MKTALTIAGSDSSGGAGIQADMKTMMANGVYAMSAVTALTAQNTTGVAAIMEAEPEFLAKQIDCVFEDIRPDAVKIGMVSSAELTRVIGERLRAWKAENIVVDPVMVATSGARLISPEAVEALKEELFPIATVLTPNIPEAEVLWGQNIETEEEMRKAAEAIGKRWECAVLVKGGHSVATASDLLYWKGNWKWFRGKRIDNPNTHGTGCTLSSALAANLAKGFSLETSVERAKAYISGALLAMLNLGKGSGPMDHGFAIRGEFTREADEKGRPALTKVEKRMAAGEELLWLNPLLGIPPKEAAPVTGEDIRDAEKRLERFAPFIRVRFPETEKTGGIIESPLVAIPHMQEVLQRQTGEVLLGRLFLKEDSHLAIAGSVKARGGIYEVLKHAENLAVAQGILKEGGDYKKLASPECRDFFRHYTVQAGSTGNLGISIGISAAALGFQTIIHMSADAKQWKKDLLRAYGVTVKEYDSDYSGAVKNGRRLSDADPSSYFVDDENSRDLFLGYAVAARRLAAQLEGLQIQVDREHPLFVYLPCGVGGAPGGITFGLKQQFGDNVHCFFVEPVQAPCMLLGMETGRHHNICVQDIGLSGKTLADGLAVGRPSGFVGRIMEPLVSGIFTVQDEVLPDYMKKLYQSEGLFIEPSACAAFEGVTGLFRHPQGRQYIKDHGLEERMGQAVHIAWATGGSLVPEEERKAYLA